MRISQAELKRKVFHHLSLVYMAMYACLPRWVVVPLLGMILVMLGCVEFLRLRRPELNAWFLRKFGGIHRPREIVGPSGIFWTLLGCWLTMAVFESRTIVLPALGFLVFGDTAAALVGHTWGKRHWRGASVKTWEGSASFALISAAWAALFLRWPVALLGAIAGAWIESRTYPWRFRFWPLHKSIRFADDNIAIPLLSGIVLSILNLTIGKH